MELTLLSTAAVFLTLFGYCLIKRRALKAAEPREYLRTLGPKGWRQIVCWIAIPLSLIAVGAMYYVFYQESVLLILKRMTLLAVLWPIAITDFKEFRIPNKMLLIGLGFRLLFMLPELLILEKPFDLWKSEGIAALVGGVLSLICGLMSGGSLGAGDMKLVFVMGLFLGMQPLFYCMFFSIFIAFFSSIVLLISKKKNRKDSIPFAPFIMIGSFIAFILTGT